VIVVATPARKRSDSGKTGLEELVVDGSTTGTTLTLKLNSTEKIFVSARTHTVERPMVCGRLT
jgi:hypothetical protein